MVRIVYRLQKDAQKKGSYSLLRQEGTDLEFGAYKKGSAVKGYELIKGIKNITIEFQVPKEPLNEGQKKDTKKSEQPIIFETKKEWHSNEFQKDKKQSQLPQFVLVELTLWDNQLVNDRTIKMLYTIPAFGQDLVVTKTQESKMPLPKKDEKKEPDKKEQAATGQNKIVTQRRRVFPDTSELRSTIQDYMNSIRGRAS